MDKKKVTKEKHIDKCMICGKMKKLTFEHIPPHKALNNNPARSVTGDEVIELITSKERMPWDINGLHYVNQQKGVGLYSICEKCNNLTGTLYGDEYCRVAKSFAYFMENNADQIEKSNGIEVTVKDMYPCRFIKQVLSMFCSTTPGFSEKYSEIKKILLDKDKKLNTPNFRISMYLLKNQKFSWTGLNVEFHENGSFRSLSNMDLYPFGFVLDYDKNYIDERTYDITYFLNYGYEQKSNIKLVLPLHERNMPFPCDFRTKDEIEKMISKT